MSNRGHSSYKRFSRKEFIRNRKHWFFLLFLVLAVLLAGAAVYYVHWSQSREKVYYSEIGDCSLPVLTMIFHGQPINRTFGYTEEMDFKYIRDSIYILDSGYDIPVRIQMYGNQARSLDLFVYDMETENLIQSGKLTDYEMTDEDILSTRLHIDNIIEPGNEYFMDIRLVDATGRTIHYYSRVMLDTTSPVVSMMNMVQEHHDAMYDKTKTQYLAQFQQTNSAVNDSTNFGNISLSSTLNSMYWGTMGVSVITEPVLTIVDLDNDIAFFRLIYQVGRSNEDGTKEYYNVSEYYRTRMFEEKLTILSYERTVNQIFVPYASHILNKSVLIGIEHDLNIQTLTNTACNRNVFVVGKAIWFMDTDTKTLQKVFSFEEDPTDIRQNYAQHDIRLLKITEQGDFQFLVYGYMNRGLHEGQVGVGLYTYHSDSNEVREDFFIPSHLPYQVLKNSVGSLCYLNNEGILFIMLDEYIYRLDPENNKATMLVSGLNRNNFKMSVSGRMVAWQNDGYTNDAIGITVKDLEEETTYYVTAPEGKSIKVLGFLDQDLVYGEGDSGNIYTTADGEEYLLMDDLYVVNSKKELQSSEHSARGFFVTSVVEYNRVVVNRVALENGQYEQADEFTLFSTDLESHPAASTYTTYDEDRRTISFLEVVKNMEPNRPAVINEDMSITLCSAKTTDVRDMLSDNGKYYIYAAGEITAILTNPTEAILEAYYDTGVAITNDGYFYKRTSRPMTMELTNTSVEKAGQAYKNGTALNVTGIYLMQALYYTGRKIPVIWEWGENVYVIYGYDLYDNLMLRNIYTDEDILIAYDDIDPFFDEVGRCFILWQNGE